MIFSDGECPACEASQLHLNTSDLMECPHCHLVCVCRDGLLAAVLPIYGSGDFRFEDCAVAQYRGIGFAKPLGESLFADAESIFYTRAELRGYLSTIPRVNIDISVAEILFERFIEKFRCFISSISFSEIEKIWESKKARTAFYAERAMPAVAAELGLTHGQEEFNVDYVMSKLSRSGHLVPRVFVESENDYLAATQEFRKLCAINSPLRILLTVTSKEIRSDPKSPAHGQLREWQSIVRSNFEQNPDFKGVIGVIIARKIKPGVEFHACAFRSSGDLLRPLSRLLIHEIA